MPTFIVESYGDDSGVADQRERAELVGDLGGGISYIRTTVVPADQTLLHLFEATSSDALRAAVAAAALDCDRIVEVVEADAALKGADRFGRCGAVARRSPDRTPRGRS
jgi:hypothetical protein